MKINSNISIMLFVLLITWGSIRPMIIKGANKTRRNAYKENKGTNIERELMDEIYKEKEKNKMLKDLLHKQENLSKEMDEKLQTKDDSKQTEKNDNPADKTTQKELNESISNDKKEKRQLKAQKPDEKKKVEPINETRNKPVTKTQSTSTSSEANNRNLKSNNKQKNISNNSKFNRKLKKSNETKDNLKKSKNLNTKADSKSKEQRTLKKQNKALGKSKNLAKEIPAKKTKSKKIVQNSNKREEARKLSVNRYRRRLRRNPVNTSHPPHRAMKNVQPKRIHRPMTRYTHRPPMNKVQMKYKINHHRRLVKRPFPHRPAAKRLAVTREKYPHMKPVHFKTPVKNFRHLKTTHRVTNTPHDHFVHRNRRNLWQHRVSKPNSYRPSIPRKKHMVPVRKPSRNYVNNKHTAVKRKLVHRIVPRVYKNNSQTSNINHNKKPQRWRKYSRKLAKKPAVVGNKNKNNKRILKENEDKSGDGKYPVKLMNASISYPVLGMVNLNNGEYDLHVS